MSESRQTLTAQDNHSSDQLACALVKLNDLVSSMAEAVFVINQDGVIELLNPIMASYLGAPRDTLVGQPWHQFLHERYREYYQQLISHWNGRSKLPITHGPSEVILNKEDGRILEVDLSLSVVPSSFCAEHKLIMGVVHNLSNHKETFRDLKKLANTDQLTGLANRYQLENTINRVWNDAVNNQQPLSFIMIDIDYFKVFNDTYGHLNGDACLRKVAQVIGSALPSRDCLAARYGGEEFVVVLPRCHEQDAQHVAKQIQHRIAQLQFLELGLPSLAKVTVSQGISTEENGQFRTVQGLLSAADTALYRAKSEGRNRIHLSA